MKNKTNFVLMNQLATETMLPDCSKKWNGIILKHGTRCGTHLRNQVFYSKKRKKNHSANFALYICQNLLTAS